MGASGISRRSIDLSANVFPAYGRSFLSVVPGSGRAARRCKDSQHGNEQKVFLIYASL